METFYLAVCLTLNVILDLKSNVKRQMYFNQIKILNEKVMSILKKTSTEIQKDT
jgi:hypothetical protein